MRTIHSLEDLRVAKRELAQKKKASKREFAKHLGALRQDATGYVVKRVVLPVGLGIVAAFAIKYIFFNKKGDDLPVAAAEQKKATEEVKEDVHKNTWLSYFSILLSIIKIYQTAVAQKQAEQAMEDDDPIYRDEGRDDGQEPVSPDPGPDMTANEAPASDETGEEELFSPQSFARQYQQQKNAK